MRNGGRDGTPRDDGRKAPGAWRSCGRKIPSQLRKPAGQDWTRGSGRGTSFATPGAIPNRRRGGRRSACTSTSAIGTPYDRYGAGIGPMTCLESGNSNMTVAAGRERTVHFIAAVLIGLALFATFRAGIMRDLHSTFADQSWGRVQFSIGAAITSLYHGGYGYTISNVVKTVLASGGLTGDPIMLKAAGVTFPDNLRNPNLMESAIRKAIAFNWPFNPGEQVTGSSGEDVGLVDYVRLSFILFGNKVVGFFFTYFALVAMSF